MKAGFTLIEVLMIIAILGLLMAVGLPRYLQYRQALLVQQGAQQFARDVDNARTQAKATNTCRVFVVVGNSSYRVDAYTSRYCTGTPVSRVYTMPATTKITLRSSQASATFVPPYGVNSTGRPVDVTVTSTSSSKSQVPMRVTAVMGTVVRQ